MSFPPKTGIRRVAVFCGASLGVDPIYAETADLLGRSIAQRGWGLVYGGAKSGLMGTLADGALAVGGEVYGVLPERLSAQEIAHEGLTELFIVDSMHARKAMMAILSDGFCVLPGGLGTLDEAFEIMTWGQLGFHQKPVGFLGPNGFWQHLVAHADHAMQEGFIQSRYHELLVVTDSVVDVLSHIEAEAGGGCAGELTARGRADELTARGRADELTARGRADELTARGRADELTARGRADELTARGRADELTARGRADELTARGRADELTARGRADELTARGRPHEDALTS